MASKRKVTDPLVSDTDLLQKFKRTRLNNDDPAEDAPHIPETENPGIVPSEDEDTDGDDLLESKKSHLSNEYYTVGWMCAIPIELSAAELFLAKNHGIPQARKPGDNNLYTLGEISGHNVVIATMPFGEYGTATAAGVAASMLQSFPNVRFGLLVGVAGGVPIQGDTHVHLGDIVVGYGEGRKHGGVIQYDYGKEVQGQDFEETHFLNQSPEILRSALARLVNWKSCGTEALGKDITKQIQRMLKKGPDDIRHKFSRPSPETDRLFLSEVSHKSDDCGCQDGTQVEDGDLILRWAQSVTSIHYGLIGSGNTLMKDAVRRDELARKFPYLCFEMEAGGVINRFPCLVIRGICDYADSHKNKIWQPYAALVASAYARAVLAQISPSEVETQTRLRDLLLTVDAKMENVIDLMENQLHHEGLTWASTTDFLVAHKRAHSLRHKGTGQWFLSNPEFVSWVEASSGTLLCPGIPGAGKTVLSSLIIEHIFDKFKNDETIGVAHVYCSYQQNEAQTTEVLIRSILRQLAIQKTRGGLRQSFKSFWEQKKKNVPSTEEWTKATGRVSEEYDKIYIVVDALDELHEKWRSKFLTFLSDLRTAGGKRINLLITFRTGDNVSCELRDLFVKSSQTVEISAKDNDIRAYLITELETIRKRGALADNMEKRLVLLLCRRAAGMFLLVKLQLDSLSRSAITPGHVTDFIKGLENQDHQTPNSLLCQLYHSAMDRITRQEDAAREMALHTLSWIVHARRPLEVDELLETFSVRSAKPRAAAPVLDKMELRRDYIPSIEQLSSLCANLITVDSIGNVGLVHSTTQEYFLAYRERWFPFAEANIAKLLVGYLALLDTSQWQPSTYELFHLFQEEDNYIWVSPDAYDRYMRDADYSSCRPLEGNFYAPRFTHPLFFYASSNWGHHARTGLSGNDPVVEDATQAVVAFLKTKSEHSWVAFPGLGHGLEACRRSLLLTEQLAIYAEGIHVAAFFGIKEAVQLLIGANPQLTNTTDSSGRTPLLYAAQNQHFETVDALLHAPNIDVNLVDVNRRSALIYAIQFESKNCERIVKLLLFKGNARTDIADRNSWTALMWAVHRNRVDCLQLLLDEDCPNKANLNDIIWDYPEFDGEDVEEHYRAGMSRILTKAGTDPISQKSDCKVNYLILAAMSEADNVIRFLLEKGESPHMELNSGFTVLGFLTRIGTYHCYADLDPDIMGDFLWVSATDPNVPDSSGRTPLDVAVDHGCYVEAAVLVGFEAKVELASEATQISLLKYCIESGRNYLVKQLLDVGVKLKHIPLEIQDALLIGAVENGYLELVKMLLDLGVRVNASHGRTALSHAAEEGHFEIAEILLKGGADAHSQDNRGWTALHHAAASGSWRIVDAILNRGLSPNIRDSNGLTPLYMASIAGHLEVVQRLLKRGGDALIRHNLQETTPLHVATIRGYRDIVSTLLPHSDIEATDCVGKTAFHMASSYGQSSIVDLFLELPCLSELGEDHQMQPVNINLTDGRGQTPLYLASRDGHVEVVRTLLSKGADAMICDRWLQNTPLHVAVENGHKDIVLILLPHSDIEATNRGGQTPLHYASIYGQDVIMDILLHRPHIDEHRRGYHIKPAHINSTDGQGGTPLFLAAVESINLMDNLKYRPFRASLATVQSRVFK